MEQLTLESAMDHPHDEVMVLMHDDGTPATSIACSETTTSIDTKSSVLSQEHVDNVEKQVEDELQEPIASVADTEQSSVQYDKRTKEMIDKIKSSMEYESIDVLESGEIVVLPAKWTMRASKTHGGKIYYVSPFGHTQWLRPSMKTGLQYQWVHELEVTFGDGRLGLNLKQILSEPGAEFSDIQVHISEIYKLANGIASPAEIYNWSVKPEKRLYVGMRVTAINDISLIGYSYTEVLDMISRLPRPLRIKFADISKGVVGYTQKPMVAMETELEREARRVQDVQSLLRLEYFQILVACELHSQVWRNARAQMIKKEIELSKKIDILNGQVEAQTEFQTLLRQEQETMMSETAALESSLQTLELQEEGKIPSPEALKATELIDRYDALNQEISELLAEIETLRQERTSLETLFDAVRQESDRYDDLDDQDVDESSHYSNPLAVKPVDYKLIDGSTDDSNERLLEKVKTRYDTLMQALEEEENITNQITLEIQSHKRQLALVEEAAKREDDLISGEKPAQLILLETKIEGIREALRESVNAITVATQENDLDEAEKLSKRRNELKEELKTALDEMQQVEMEFNCSSTGSSRLTDASDVSSVNQSRDDVSVKRSSSDKVSRRNNLHNTVKELARASSNKEVKELTDRRLEIKEKKVQEVQKHGALSHSSSMVSSLSRSHSNGAVTSRARSASAAVIPTNMSNVKATDKIVADTSINPSNLISSVHPISAHPHPIHVPRESDGSDESQSTVESRPSITQVADATAKSKTTLIDPYRASDVNNSRSSLDMPHLSGLLLKHPSRSNDRGIFGNMSLRGVRERYFVLDGSNALKYYKRKGDREMRGYVPLDDPTLEIVYAKTDTKNLEFSLCTPKHQNRFVGKTRDEVLKWVHALEVTHKLLMEKSRLSDSRQTTSMDGRPNSSASGSFHRLSGSFRSQPDRATLGF